MARPATQSGDDQGTAQPDARPARFRGPNPLPADPQRRRQPRLPDVRRRLIRARRFDGSLQRGQGALRGGRRRPGGAGHIHRPGLHRRGHQRRARAANV